MDARTTPQQVDTRGIGRLTTERVMELAAKGKTVVLSAGPRARGKGFTCESAPK